MANKLTFEMKTMAVSMLCEGNSIRAIERMTGVHRDTIMRLGVRMGEGCKELMSDKFTGLNCKLIQVDELWGFIGAKKKTVKQKNLGPEFGDVWTWVALDAETKLVLFLDVGRGNEIHVRISLHRAFFDLKDGRRRIPALLFQIGVGEGFDNRPIIHLTSESAFNRTLIGGESIAGNLRARNQAARQIVHEDVGVVLIAVSDDNSRRQLP